jgi:hypothetical protein
MPEHRPLPPGQPGQQPPHGVVRGSRRVDRWAGVVVEQRHRPARDLSAGTGSTRTRAPRFAAPQLTTGAHPVSSVQLP